MSTRQAARRRGVQVRAVALALRPTCRRLVYCWLACASWACDPGEGREAVYPPAEAFDANPVFIGSWRGQVGEQEGVMHLGELSPGRYFANFTASRGRLELALLLEQSQVRGASGAAVPSNRLLFTWQDGDGQRGHGWLKLDAPGTLLQGSSGALESISGANWRFVRDE